jgi:hypothetical protein
VKTNTGARALNDVGLAAWFGGSLMGAVGLNGAAASVDDPAQRSRVASVGWARWTPVNLSAIAMVVTGGSILAYANKSRVLTQAGVARWSAAKIGLTLAALAATAYSRVLGQRIISAGDVPVEGGTTPAPQTPETVVRTAPTERPAMGHPDINRRAARCRRQARRAATTRSRRPWARHQSPHLGRCARVTSEAAADSRRHPPRPWDPARTRHRLVVRGGVLLGGRCRVGPVRRRRLRAVGRCCGATAAGSAPR